MAAAIYPNKTTQSSLHPLQTLFRQHFRKVTGSYGGSCSGTSRHDVAHGRYLQASLQTKTARPSSSVHTCTLARRCVSKIKAWIHLTVFTFQHPSYVERLMHMKYKLYYFLTVIVLHIILGMITKMKIFYHVDTNGVNDALSSTLFAFVHSWARSLLQICHSTLSPPYYIFVKNCILEGFVKGTEWYGI